MTKIHATRVVRNVSVRTGERPVDYIDGFPGWSVYPVRAKREAMNISKSYSTGLTWSLAVALSAMAIGCGGGGGRDPILGAGVAVFTVPTDAIIPGATCPAAGPTIPTVTVSTPASGNQSATTSTNGVANGGKLITATFSSAMNATTINAASFVLAPVNGAALVPASVTYNTVGNVATLTTSSALLPDTSYNAVILPTVTSAAGTPMGCTYAWTFKTAAVAAVGPAPVPVNLGLAAPFGIAATTGVTNTATAPNTTINGNVVLDPVTGAICNTVPVDAAGGFGACATFAPTLNGTVISPLFPADAGATSGAIKNDLRAAYLSITPPAGPPAAGSLGGATNIPAGTTLGEPNGAALVQGDNLFAPGVYQSLTSILITGELTLDAQGDPDASFIFQSSSTVGSATGARILLVNGAKASNVFWQAGSSATLGSNSVWQGNILASQNITMVTGAISCGRLLAGAFSDGAFVFDSNVVSVPGHANAPATCR